MVTIVFTEAHVTRGEAGPDTIELVGKCGEQVVALSAIEPRGSGDKFVRTLGFLEFTLNEPATFYTRTGREHRRISAHRVDAQGRKFRKERKKGQDFEIQTQEQESMELALEHTSQLEAPKAG